MTGPGKKMPRRFKDNSVEKNLDYRSNFVEEGEGKRGRNGMILKQTRTKSDPLAFQFVIV